MRYNLIPAAGLGKRFLDARYALPKPLISVDGMPMVVRAANTLPQADKWGFLFRKEHVELYSIDEAVRREYPDSDVIVVPSLTGGQASTCMLGESYIDSDAILTIGACDNGMVWKKSMFESLLCDEHTDVLVWTFRNHPTVARNPHMYGWVDVDNNDFVKKVSVKIPLSDQPLNDHAVVGTFTFKKASMFFNAARKMILERRTVNNEFYIDACMNVLVEEGFRIKVFEVEKYICWGTPNDLRTYEYWSNYFSTMYNKS